ncbi:MAG: 50S ribosome-binding GTPase [Planctomycetia bacterium]|nr:50S ribosome-binding GTPase [Planctomycetia bacterium]
MYPLEETIIALSSARRSGGVRGVVRLSGPDTFSALETMGLPVPCASGASFRYRGELAISSRVSLPVWVSCWREGHGYTGQESAEIHAFGAIPFLDQAISKFCAESNVRLAQPGEYTLRAFLSGRLDLTQAEGVLGAIDATDPQKLDTALRQLAGGLARPLHQLRNDLFDLMGHIEAGLDFSDEDIEFISSEEMVEIIERATEQMEALLDKMKARSLSSDLLTAVLYGLPNIGKSSLFNALLGRGAAIVHDAPGTTRDYLSSTLQLSGMECRLIDTAGDSFELETDFIHRESQNFAREQKSVADVRLYCFDAESFSKVSQSARLHEIENESNALIVLTRADKCAPMGGKIATNSKIIITSAQSGEGLDTLKERLESLLLERTGGESDVVSATQLRCRESLRLGVKALLRARLLCNTEFHELIASEVRDALDQLGVVVGAVYTEDLLDSIFSRFCVGK